MANKLTNPKKIIHDYYDSLVRYLDIYVEQKLEKIMGNNQEEENEKQRNTDRFYYMFRNSLYDDDFWTSESEIDWNSADPDLHKLFYSPFVDFRNRKDEIETKKTLREQQKLLLTESDYHLSEYLNRMREDLTNVLNRGRAKALTHLETLEMNFENTKSASNNKEIKNDIKSRLFGNEFMFVFSSEDVSAHCTYQGENWANKSSKFQLYLFVIDFYLSKQQLELLKYLFVFLFVLSLFQIIFLFSKT